MIKKVNPGAIVGIIIGVIIIVFGIVMIGTVNNGDSMSTLPSSSLSTSSQIQFKYSFGADFYTEMFGVTYNTLQQLVDMSADNARNLSSATNTIVHSMRTVGSLLAYVIMAIGLAVVGLSCSKLFVWIPGEKADKGLPDPEFNFRPAPNYNTNSNWAESDDQPEEAPEETEPDTGAEELPEDLPPEDGLAE